MLPAMHSCIGRQFQRILDSRTIEVGEFDPVIDMEAAFYFYGKPSYRPKSGNKYTDRLRSAIFCFVLDYGALPAPAGVLPFDSGGYDRIYREVCDDMPLADFKLPCELATPGRIVSAFFGGNKSYYATKLREGAKKQIKTLDFHSQGFLDICSPNRAVEYDQRAMSIELHYDEPIELVADTLLAIVVPETACDDAELVAFARSCEADLIPYALDLDDMNARQRQVRDAIQIWLTRNGLLSR